MTKEELVAKAKEFAKDGIDYCDAQANWNGDEWDMEYGYFKEDGVVRFAGTPMEIFETYEEIDDDILADCIACANVDDDDE